VLAQQQVDQHGQHHRGDNREQHHEQAPESATERADLEIPKAHAGRLTADTNRKPSRRPHPVGRAPDSISGGLTRPRPHRAYLPCLIIRLIIQTIRRDRSGSDQIDDPSNVSRPDPCGSRSGTGAAGSRPAHDQKGSAMELVVDLLTFFALTAGGMLPLTKAARIC
jgi:hypothetical protein